MSREHFSIRNFNDSSFNYKYFVRINNKISKFINFHPNIYTYESQKVIAIANYTHMLDIFASYKLNRWKSVDSPECVETTSLFCSAFCYNSIHMKLKIFLLN